MAFAMQSISSSHFFPELFHSAVGIRRAWHPPCSRFPVPISFQNSSTVQWASVEHGIRHARRAQARQPRTTFSPLLPTLYCGSPLHSDHALLPPFFSLLSTFTGALKRASHALPSPLFSLLSTAEAHCKVSTHYLLPSSPYSLLLEAHCKVTTHYPLPSSPYSLLPCPQSLQWILTA